MTNSAPLGDSTGPGLLTELAARLSVLPVAVLADVLDRLGHRYQVMSGSMRPVAAPRRIAGPAFPIQAVARATLPDSPYEREIEATDAVPPGSVIVFNSGGVTDAGVWGELLTTRASARGCIGAVIDGGVRDLAGIDRLDFPTYATAIHPADSYGRVEVISYGEPIVCGGVPIEAGDLVVGDTDGIVVVPRDLGPAVVEAADEKRSKENAARAMLDAGATVAATYARHRVL